MLSLPIRNLHRVPLWTATAVVVALVAAAPSQAAPTAVEGTSATSFNYALPASATSFNYTLPGDSTALNFSRKAG